MELFFYDFKVQNKHWGGIESKNLWNTKPEENVDIFYVAGQQNIREKKGK